MKPVRDLAKEKIDRIRYVCTDIDDTLTRDGRLCAPTYRALWDLHDAGISVIPVTGRPAGWCDLIARQWPAEAVVGENGAFAFYMEREKLMRLFHPSAASQEVTERLGLIRERVLSEIPGTRVAKDQFSRMFDLAIDFREELPDLGLDTAERIAAVCEEMGATAKISSIHVNIWIGDYSKVDMIEYYLKVIRGIDPALQKEVVIYCGDSPNDAPMFQRFPLSCGVANIRPLLHLVEHPPTFVTDASHGNGFIELATTLLGNK
ncbi:MAG: HAD-IIB family hydrolase [Spirochaetales bacterium]|nr:HAD-IIB family hydrolase [Spirochaetales bacterium]